MRFPRFGYICLLITVLLADAIPGLAQQGVELTVRDVMAEPSIAGMRPEGERISPNGEWVAFLWSAQGREPRDLYLVSTRGGAPKLLVPAVDTPKKETEWNEEKNGQARTGERKEESVTARVSTQQERAPSVTGIDWTPDSRRLLFGKQGDLYIVEARDGAVPRRLTRTVAIEGNARWLPDSRRILYQSSGNLFVIDADQTSLVQLTRESGAAAGQAAGNVVQGSRLSNDGARVAYILSDTAKQRSLVVPDFTGEFVVAPNVRRGWSEQKLQVVQTDGSTERPITIKLPAPEGNSYIRGFDWTPDNSAIIVDRIDRDTKRRQLFRADLKALTSGRQEEVTATLVDQEVDDKWVAPLSRIFEVSPDDTQLFLGSERNGFNNLFQIGLASGSTPVARPILSGSWEINWAKWMPDGRSILYSSTEASTAERHFYLFDVKTGRKIRLVTAPGMNTDPQLSKDGKMLLFQHSEWNRPNDLYAIRACVDCGENRPRQLTSTVPQRFSQVNWTRPEFVEFSAKDGKSVKARVYKPVSFDKSRRYPAVVFVHGAGYLQNVINGWNNYYREAMFHQILTGRGYVVLDIDYRGSSGYGRDWRTDVYDFLGGLDFQDHLDGVDYIIKNYSVDPARVGMYGGSYGGFMAEMAVMRAPDKFACAAALRPVADWKNYYASSPVYTTERLGYPDKNPAGYKQSSPITYADKLSKPLLILHGMVDDNVHFQDSVQLVEKLMELGKTDYFEVMFYPKENHSFTRPESWTDEYVRILRFFEKHLKERDTAR